MVDEHRNFVLNHGKGRWVDSDIISMIDQSISTLIASFET